MSLSWATLFLIYFAGELILTAYKKRERRQKARRDFNRIGGGGKNVEREY